VDGVTFSAWGGRGGVNLKAGPVVLLTVRVLASEVYGIQVYDPVTFAGVLVILAATAAAASFLPAWRIGKISPADALRAQ